MATQVTQFYYLYDTPFAVGTDWEVVIVAPNSGNAEVSFDNGATWNQANQGYDITYGGFKYRPPCYGTLGCNPPVSNGSVVLGRMVGETSHLSAVFGQIEQNPGTDGYTLAYSAVCVGSNILMNITSQYADGGITTNYQLSQTDTQKVQLSINGTPIGALTQWVDSCPLTTCHWANIFQPVSYPSSLFPLSFVFSDSTAVVPTWNITITTIDFGNPCVVAPNPTANAVNDTITTPVNTAVIIQMGANDTLCN